MITIILFIFVFSNNLRALHPIWRTVMICHRIPFENSRFINTSAAILMYFVNTTLKFSATKDGKLNSTQKIFSKGHVM